MPRQSTALIREIASIRKSFTSLATSFRRIAPILAAVPGANSAIAGSGKGMRKKPHLSLKLRAALKLQGRYMGSMRALPATKRAIVKRVRAAKGIHAAIAKARRLAS